MAKIPGLVRRGNNWQFRRRVPEHLREAFAKREFIESLKDCAFKEAAMWARKRWVYYDALIKDAEGRQALASEGGPQAPLVQDAFSEAEIRRIAVNYFLSLEDAAAKPFLNADAEQLNEQNDEELTGLLGSGPDDASVQHVARAAARRAGVEGEIAGKQFYRLAQWIYEACVEHHLRQSDRIEGLPPTVRNSAFSSDSIARIANAQGEKPTDQGSAQSRMTVSSSSPSIVGLFDAYAAERKPAPATVKSWRLKIESLVAFLGHDDAAKVTGEDIVRWKDHLASTPTKQGKLRSAKTVREGYLAAAKAVFAHATDTRVSVAQMRGEVDLYSFSRLDEFEPLAGRRKIDWGDGKRSWAQRADAANGNKPIVELAQAFREPVFPGFTNFIGSLGSLPSLPLSWIAVLSAARGVYLLTCPRTKEQYVGSAYGGDGFWGRWQSYVATGHGGNVVLKSRDPSDYQVSILEVAGSSASFEDIIAMEQLWKAKLQSRDMGLNRIVSRGVV